MGNRFYEEVKEIMPSRANPELKYLHLLREEGPNTSKQYRLFLADSERPAMIEDHFLFFPQIFWNELDAKRMFFFTPSVKEFEQEAEKVKTET